MSERLTQEEHSEAQRGGRGGQVGEWNELERMAGEPLEGSRASVSDLDQSLRVLRVPPRDAIGRQQPVALKSSQRLRCAFQLEIAAEALGRFGDNPRVDRNGHQRLPFPFGPVPDQQGGSADAEPDDVLVVMGR